MFQTIVAYFYLEATRVNRQSASCAAVIRVNIYLLMHSTLLSSSVSVLLSDERRIVRPKVQYLFYHSGISTSCSKSSGNTRLKEKINKQPVFVSKC
jgi:hypothetical protein